VTTAEVAGRCLRVPSANSSTTLLVMMSLVSNFLHGRRPQLRSGSKGRRALVQLLLARGTSQMQCQRPQSKGSLSHTTPLAHGSQAARGSRDTRQKRNGVGEKAFRVQVPLSSNFANGQLPWAP
jgi:hypothetical protein